MYSLYRQRAFGSDNISIYLRNIIVKYFTEYKNAAHKDGVCCSIVYLSLRPHFMQNIESLSFSIPHEGQ